MKDADWLEEHLSAYIIYKKKGDFVTWSRNTCQNSRGDTDTFPITNSLGQGYALSPYLFAILIDERTKYTKAEMPWCMLLAYDIMLVDKTK